MMLLAVGLAAPAALGLDPMGPPTTSHKQGRFTAGIDYSYSNMDLELNDGRWIEYLDGLFSDSGQAQSFTLNNLKMNKAYVNLGYGIVDNLELFLRLGAAQADFGDSIWEDNEQFDSGAELALGAGMRAKFYEQGNLTLGALLQASWARFDGRLDAPHWAAADYAEIDLAEIQIAAGPTLRLADQISIYGGPFFHLIDGGLDDEFSGPDPAGLRTSKYSWDIEQTSTFGGYIGTRLDLGTNSFFNIEYHRTADADAVAAALLFKF
jgi:hypothetical protein